MTKRTSTPNTAATPLLRAQDVAARLNIGVSYAYELMAGGEIETIRIGRAVRVRPEAVDAYVAAHTVAPLAPRRLARAR